MEPSLLLQGCVLESEVARFPVLVTLVAQGVDHLGKVRALVRANECREVVSLSRPLKGGTRFFTDKVAPRRGGVKNRMV